MVKVGDIVKIRDQMMEPEDIFGDAESHQINLAAHEEFNKKNGLEWKVVGRATGWWSDTQPWIIKSVKSGQEIERFEADLTVFQDA